jgi:hypothetical protein
MSQPLINHFFFFIPSRIAAMDRVRREIRQRSYYLATALGLALIITVGSKDFGDSLMNAIGISTSVSEHYQLKAKNPKQFDPRVYYNLQKLTFDAYREESWAELTKFALILIACVILVEFATNYQILGLIGGFSQRSDAEEAETWAWNAFVSLAAAVFIMGAALMILTPRLNKLFGAFLSTLSVYMLVEFYKTYLIRFEDTERLDKVEKFDKLEKEKEFRDEGSIEYQFQKENPWATQENANKAARYIALFAFSFCSMISQIQPALFAEHTSSSLIQAGTLAGTMLSYLTFTTYTTARNEIFR